MRRNLIDYIRNYLRPHSMLVVRFQRQLFRCACRILMMEQKAAWNNNNRHRISSKHSNLYIHVIDFFLSRHFREIKRKGENEIEGSYLSFDRYLLAQEYYMWTDLGMFNVHKPQCSSFCLRLQPSQPTHCKFARALWFCSLSVFQLKRCVCVCMSEWMWECECKWLLSMSVLPTYFRPKTYIDHQTHTCKRM